MKILYYCFLFAIYSVTEGLGVAQTDPESGSLIADFEGTENVTTLVCNITNPSINDQDITVWSIGNFRGFSGVNTLLLNTAPELFEFGGDPIPATPMFNFNNRLTILRLTTDLDEAIVYCGTGSATQLANFMFRVYRPPILVDNFIVRVLENSRNFTIDISQNRTAFPMEAVSFSWTKDGQPLTTGPTLTCSSVIFSRVERQDSGNYSVFASNVVRGREVGNDTGSFYLVVIYGPSFRVLGPTLHYITFNDSLSLVCGTGLDSNPQATIIWTDPDGATIMDNARYDLESGPEIVRLNITRAILNDTGMWLCEVIVRSERHIISNGTLTRGEETVIGTPIQHKIMIIVIAPPGQPNNLSVDSTKPTSVLVGWNPPLMADSPITYYSVRACNLNITTAEIDKIVTNTTTNTLAVNVTGLLPGTTYELTVVAVSQGGNVVALSQPSDPVIDATEVTVPALTCNVSVSSNGVITVLWSYIHTGGLPLTNVSVCYMYKDGSTISTPVPIPVRSLDTTDVSISDLKFGFMYTFNVTAQNSNGSSSVLCGPTLLKSGSMSNLIGAAVGGVIGGCLLVGIIVTLIILLLLFIIRRRGTKNINVNTEAEYEDPDSFQQYTPRKGQSIELKDCPAYGKPISRQPDIELEECPAYVEKRREILNIKLEECPAYVEKKKDLSNIKLEKCSAYEQLRT